MKNLRAKFYLAVLNLQLKINAAPNKDSSLNNIFPSKVFFNNHQMYRVL